ncbi:hypothetical protein [Petroclostridium sp. X23]|uniref:hypothetical protein n=1 Tax=Petroclostridium sp. X23 TaxID=3045146 RepID=UPI0024AD47EB|nr:hypothetical protein [Petroclostridium sp. X23]WHH59304.1 hypothetical protein QKW49_00600 [Petroclostridium sp. X23]
MGECICNNCKNLKGIIDENGMVEQYECEFGFPSDSCSDCEDDGCDLTCEHYICDGEQEHPVIVKCTMCGKDLEQVSSDDEGGEVYCFDCYLKNI